MNRVLASLAVAALTSVAVPAVAETTVATPGVREHDGFFAQIQGGPAFLSLSEDSTDMTLDGPGFGLAVAIGGSPVRNLVLFGEVISQAAVAPTLEVGGEEIESDDSVTLSFTSIGPGAAYYFGASNFFVSGSLGLATATLAYAVPIFRAIHPPLLKGIHPGGPARVTG